MTKKLFVFLPVLALLGQGCVTGATPAPAQPVPAIPDAKVESMACPDLPQVYYFGKAYFSATEIDEIERNVIRPVVEYYSTPDRGRVVSLTIEKEEGGIIVEGITELPWSDDGGYFGFVHNTEGGAYPTWEPLETPEGYQG